MDRAIRFREAAACANRHRERMGWRYPEALRHLAVVHCEERRREQGSYREIAEELGISALTLSRWRDQLEPSRPPGFREVHLEDEAPKTTAALSVVTPGGVRIEGLDLAQAVELARALR